MTTQQSERPELRAETNCPLRASHTRLRQSHDLWHRVAAAYPDPDEFVLSLNNLIVTLRQVTFMLQTEKELIPGFDAWYEAWQKRMRADPLMAWLKDARTRVEKQGDLEIASTARVTVIADWLVEPYKVFEVNPLLSPDEVAGAIATDDLPERVRKEGVVRVERRWVSRDLPDHELTDVCAHGYGFLATMAAEAHARLGVRMRTFGGEAHQGRHDRHAHLRGRLPCMLMTREARSADLHLASGDLLVPETANITLNEGDDERFERMSEEMLLDPMIAFAPVPGEDPLEAGARFSSIARRMLAHDGYHRPIAFLLDSGGAPVDIIGLQFADQGEKYVVFRRLADAVEHSGATTVVMISEAWTAPLKPGERLSPTTPRASERPDRQEILLVSVATADGRYRSYQSPFSRDSKGNPVLGEQLVIEQDHQTLPSLEPVRAAWRRLAATAG